MIRLDSFFIYACVISSALLLASAHCWPAYCAWLIFFCFVPLWYAALFYSKVSFRHGCVWGFLFFGLQLQAIAYVILAHGKIIHGLILTFCLMTYWALQSGMWFWCAQIACSIKRKSLLWRTVCWTVITHLFFLYAYYYGFYLIGIPHGYFAALFWLPLAYHSAWLSHLAPLGLHSISFLLLLVSLVFVFCVRIGTVFSGGSALIAVCILIFVWRMPYGVVQKPAWLDNVCWLTIAKPSHHHPHDCAHALSQALRTAIAHHPQTRVFIFPESTFPFALNEYSYLSDWWWNDLLPSDALILIGGHRRYEKRLLNTLYVVSDVGITHHYDKTTLFPFIEYLPTFWNFWNRNQLKEKFRAHFYIQEYFCTARSCDALLQTYCPLVPCICSELFLDTHVSKKHPSIMRLYSVNDSWFECEYMKELMYLYAKIRTVVEGHASLYTSHSRGMYIDTKGFEATLNT